MKQNPAKKRPGKFGEAPRKAKKEAHIGKLDKYKESLLLKELEWVDGQTSWNVVKNRHKKPYAPKVLNF